MIILNSKFDLFYNKIGGEMKMSCLLFTRIKYFKQHWKLGIHLVLRTKRFGVNNDLWVKFDSIFGCSFWRKLSLLNPKKFKENLLMIHYRALICYFLTDEEVLLAYGINREAAVEKYFRK